MRVLDDDARQVRDACEQLVHRYATLIDEGRAAEVVDLFTDDAVWMAPGVEMHGRAELQRGFQHRQEQTARVSRHVCTTFDVVRTGPDEAEGIVYLTLYRHDLRDGEKRPAPLQSPALVGAYHDRFVRTDDGWLIGERRLVTDFAATGAD